MRGALLADRFLGKKVNILSLHHLPDFFFVASDILVSDVLASKEAASIFTVSTVRLRRVSIKWQVAFTKVLSI